MDNGLANVPLPLAIALTAAGVGGGGVGTWSLLAARAVSHPAVQQAVSTAANAPGASLQQVAWVNMEAAMYFAAGAAAAACFCVALLTAFVCGGGLAATAAWSLARTVGSSRDETRLQDLDALAHQLEAGGPAAQLAAAAAIHAEPADLAAWAQSWRRAAEGPQRRRGRNGPRR